MWASAMQITVVPPAITMPKSHVGSLRWKALEDTLVRTHTHACIHTDTHTCTHVERHTDMRTDPPSTVHDNREMPGVEHGEGPDDHRCLWRPLL